MAASRREAKTIQVFFRVRPPNNKELQRGDKCNYLQFEQGHSVRLSESKQPYRFHGIFPPGSRQEDVFDKVARDAVLDAFDGYIGLMFAYGQTGTGKTFTMSCQDPENLGVFQRAMEMTFNKIKEDSGGEYELSCSFIQIYQEVIQDLLGSKFSEHEKKGLAIREDPDSPGLVKCHPLKEVPLYKHGDSPEESKRKAIHTFLQGDANRSVSATKMNDQSSRSHTVFTLKITRRNRMTDADYDQPGGAQKEELKGQLILVDLAGCERQKKTGTEGKGLGEANAINGSLLVLGKVIKALTDPKQHVPFRESKLTRLLQYPLSGRGRTTLIVTAGPSEENQDETRSAIEFGMRAMTIKANAQKHVEIDYKAAYLKLKAQVDEGMDEGHARALEECRQQYEEQLEERDERIKELEREVARLSTGGAASPTPDETPGRKADLSGKAQEYKEKYYKAKQGWADAREEVDDLKQKLRSKRDELGQQRSTIAALQKEMQKLRLECDVNQSTRMELAYKMRRRMERMADEKAQTEQQLTQIRRNDHLSAVGALRRQDFRSRDDTSDDEGDGSDRSDSSDRLEDLEDFSMGDPSPRDDTKGPEERLQEVWEQKMRLGERLRRCLTTIHELDAYNKKMKQAIRFQATVKAGGGDVEKEQLRSQVAKLEERCARYKQALITIHEKQGSPTPGSSPCPEPLLAERSVRTDPMSLSMSQAARKASDTLENGGKKEKKEKKKEKKERREEDEFEESSRVKKEKKRPKGDRE
eukprot:TRINITY_DN65126_c0_g1_i1.p1 TRINITY_DN65126_c0_g1~~TRINITY_DN65126_c0_g1_i1.p1  ORF type:complete len:784 (+),score=291.25 TRINITY_DN65126_c0_g1_i1:87-2354(+)